MNATAPGRLTYVFRNGITSAPLCGAVTTSTSWGADFWTPKKQKHHSKSKIGRGCRSRNNGEHGYTVCAITWTRLLVEHVVHGLHRYTTVEANDTCEQYSSSVLFGKGPGAKKSPSLSVAGQNWKRRKRNGHVVPLTGAVQRALLMCRKNKETNNNNNNRGRQMQKQKVVPTFFFFLGTRIVQVLIVWFVLNAYDSQKQK